jgi:tetratricopeptide (TPR) repeat protein
MFCRLTTGLLLLALLCGCASAPQSAALLQAQPPAFDTQFRIADLPFFPQDPYQCGPAALATVLSHSGLAVTPAQLVPLVYVPERQGSFQIELVAAARSFGRLAYTLPPSLDDLLAEVQAGHPVVVLQNLALTWYPRWHFAVVKGYDPQSQRVLLNSGDIENYAVALRTFERTWARAGHWALVVLVPGIVPLAAQALPYFGAAFALEESGQLDAALAAYVGGLQRWPQERSLLMAQGNLHYARGQGELALADFNAVVQYHPDFPPAHNNLAQLYHERGEAEAALRHAQRAVALGGEFAEIYRATLQMIEAAQLR